MAVLGSGGILEISREIPNAMALSAARLNGTTISLASQSDWTGDHVIIASADGVPIDVNGDGYADCPDGHGMYYGSAWTLGPSRNSLTTRFYTSGGDSGDFYNNASSTGLTTQIDGYMSRDVLDRIRLWATEGAAHAESGTEKAIVAVKPHNFIIAHYDNDASYISAIDTAANSIQPLTLPDSEQRLSSVITLPTGFNVVCENRDWKLQCDLEEWVMSIDASNLDITAIGDTFGEHIKSLVRGAGSLQFLAEHSYVDTEQDGLALLRLVLLTQNQCNTKARFYLYKDRTAPSPRIDGSVYYECDILLTNTRLNTRATEAIAGTADFVATSEIKLKVAA